MGGFPGGGPRGRGNSRSPAARVAGGWRITGTRADTGCVEDHGHEARTQTRGPGTLHEAQVGAPHLFSLSSGTPVAVCCRRSAERQRKQSSSCASTMRLKPAKVRQRKTRGVRSDISNRHVAYEVIPRIHPEPRRLLYRRFGSHRIEKLSRCVPRAMEPITAIRKGLVLGPKVCPFR